jgi:hypothetical protein
MPRPLRINVGGADYDVTWHLDKTPIIQGDEEVNKVGDEAMGYTNVGMQYMVVRGQPAAGFYQERDTMMHEVMHAVLSVTAIDTEMDDEKAELMVSRLTPAILDTLRRNPHLVQYLMEEQT